MGTAVTVANAVGVTVGNAVGGLVGISVGNESTIGVGGVVGLMATIWAVGDGRLQAVRRRMMRETAVSCLIRFIYNCNVNKVKAK